MKNIRAYVTLTVPVDLHSTEPMSDDNIRWEALHLVQSRISRNGEAWIPLLGRIVIEDLDLPEDRRFETRTLLATGTDAVERGR